MRWAVSIAIVVGVVFLAYQVLGSSPVPNAEVPAEGSGQNPEPVSEHIAETARPESRGIDSEQSPSEPDTVSTVGTEHEGERPEAPEPFLEEDLPKRARDRIKGLESVLDYANAGESKNESRSRLGGALLPASIGTILEVQGRGYGEGHPQPGPSQRMFVVNGKTFIIDDYEFPVFTEFIRIDAQRDVNDLSAFDALPRDFEEQVEALYLEAKLAATQLGK